MQYTVPDVTIEIHYKKIHLVNGHCSDSYFVHHTQITKENEHEEC